MQPIITKDSDKWQTPAWIMEHFKFHYDPCPPNPTTDGLNTDWKSTAFVNPPYSKPKEWVVKALEQQKHGVHSCLLLRVDPSTEWYKKLIEGGGGMWLISMNA